MDRRGRRLKDGVDDVRLSCRRVLLVAPAWKSIATGALEPYRPATAGVESARGRPAGAVGILSGHAAGPVIGPVRPARRAAASTPRELGSRGDLLAPTLLLQLSRRGHVVVGVGSQLPVAGKRPFDRRVGAELYWEYADGPIWAW